MPIHTSKQKGLWMGGTVPFGYRVESRKLLIDESEAEIVRLIFAQYLQLGSLPALQDDLRTRGILTRRRPLSSGKIRGGVPFTTGPLHQVLTNRIYLGEMNHKGRSFAAEHPAIVERAVFEAVQARLAANRNSHHARLHASEALLRGRLHDDRGNRMTPTHARKGAARYRYYVSLALTKGRKEEAGSVCRVSAPEVEQIVLAALRAHVAERLHSTRSAVPDTSGSWCEIAALDDRALVARLLYRAIVGQGTIELMLLTGGEEEEGSETSIRIPWTPQCSRRRREIVVPEADRVTKSLRPMRPEVRANILRAIARARCWREQLIEGDIQSFGQIAGSEKCSERSVRMTFNLAFLAPDIVQAVVEGTLPRGIGLSRLAELPADWKDQRQALGITHIV